MAKIDIKDTIDKVEEKVKDAAKSIEDSVKNFDVDKAKESVLKATESGFRALRKHIIDAAETKNAAKEALKKKEIINDSLITEDALKILYLLMYSDNRVVDDERKKFETIQNELDHLYKVDRKALVKYCDDRIAKSQGDEYIDYILDEITDIINHSKEAGNGTIPKKLLMWNLLALAYSDDDYTKEEKDIVRAVARRLQIEKNIIQEMELAILAMISIGKEKDIPGSNKEELDTRINNIMQGAKQLIGD